MKEKKYIKITELIFINCETNVFELFYLLLLRTKPFNLFNTATRYKLLNKSPMYITKFFRVIQFVCKFYKIRNKQKNGCGIENINLYSEGQLLLILRLKEYKIFNF